ncbi:PASTA domain-containing protein [Kribbella sp. NPDC051718]|uniref:PASTA domain-containing protein n=1 Tax=Kribbella sp. NPDC051718 TaxID=3155168 RepID=UPI003423B1DE
MELDGRRPVAGTTHLRRLLVMCVLAVLLALPAAGAAQAGNGHPGSLKLDPASGLPGSWVTAVASDYDRCLPVEPPPPVPEPSSGPGEPVAAPAAERVAGGRVEFRWDGSTLVAEATDTGDGVVSAEFLVPEGATTGAHTVMAKCRGTDSLDVSASFEVTRAETEQPAIVPDLIGMDRDAAEKAVLGAKLSVGRVSGQGDKVTTQSPGSGTEAEPGSPVDIDLRPVKIQPPRTVVPNVVGRSLTKARAVLRGRRLVLGSVAGTGKIVMDQRPVPGSRVLVGTAVGVSTRSDIKAPVMIRVPDLKGRKVSTARSTLTAVGLRLGGTPQNDRIVATQRPLAGTFVTAGRLVTVSLVAIPLVPVPDLVDSEPADARKALLAVVLAGAVAGAARLLRLRLNRRWVRRMVRVVPTAAPLSVPAITKTDANPAMPVVRIEPRGDRGTHILERHDS